MKKRSAEKVISRSILALAPYRKSTMGKALRRRPSFWTVSGTTDDPTLRPSKRMRLEFDQDDRLGGLTFVYDEAVEAEGN